MGNEALATNLRTAFLAARDADAPLNVRLAMYTRALEENLPAYAQNVDELIARLTAAGAGGAAPNAGDPMPDFLLPDTHGRLVSLSELLRDGPAAIVFLRGHWCPYCRLAANALARVHEQVRPSARHVAVLTPERQVFAQQILEEAGGTYPVLTDIGNGYALSLNLAIWLGEDIRNVLMGFGRDLGVYQSDPGWFVPIPATFIVGSDGLITARFVDPDYRRRMDGEALVAALNLAV